MQKLYNETSVENIAEAIREPLNSSETFKIREMAPAIENMANTLKSYIPKSTTEEKSFKAIPLSMKQKINGKVKQTQYEGYNLLSEYDFSNMTLNKNGNPTNLIKEKDYYSFVTSDIYRNGIYFGTSIFTSKVANFDAEKQYYLSIEVVASQSTRVNFGIDSLVTKAFEVDTTPKRIEVLTQIGKYIITYHFAEISGITLKFSKPMISEVPTTNYEPYVGGQVSPNPKYPQEVKTLKCVNLLDPSILEQGYYEIRNNTPTLEGTSDGRYRTFVKELKAGTYTICSSSTINGIRTYPAYSITELYWGNFTNVTSKTITITQDTIVYFGIRKSDNTAWNDDVDKLWVVEGTEPQPYTPYGYIREDFVGKNKFDYKSRYIFTNSKASNEIIQTNDTIKIIKAENAQYVMYIFKVSDMNEIIGKNVTISCDNIETSSNTTNSTQCDLIYCDTNGENRVSLSKFYNSNDKQQATVIIPNIANKILAIRIYADYSSSNIGDWGLYKNIQVEIGSTATPYEPYQEPKSSLIYIGENELLTDDFVEVDEKGFTKGHKEWGKVAFNNTINIAKPSDIDNLFYFYITSIPNVKFGDIYCSYYKGIKDENISANNSANRIMNFNEMAMRYGTTDRIYIKDNRFNSSIDLKNWLINNKVEIYYQLATPTEIDLGKHDKLIPLQGYNDISVTATLEPSKITTTHYFDYNDIQSAMLLAEPEL